MPDIDHDTLIPRLADAFKGLTGHSSAHQRATDFCFHMADWKQDLIELAEVMNHPESVSDERFEEVILGFLIHASGHINAATKLIGHEPVEFEMP